MIWLALVAAFALYWPVLHGEFVFDDLPSIWKSPEVWKGNWRWFSLKRWRALPYGSFAAQIALHGPAKEGPIPPTLMLSLHAGNIFLHALCAFVVGQMMHSSVAMLLWVAMPVAVASVAYLSSRATLMAALFSLLGLWSVLGGVPVLALPCIVLAVMSKEDHAAIPFGLAAAAYSVGLLGWAALFAALPLVFGAVFYKKVAALAAVAHSPSLDDAGIPSALPKERRLTIFVELVLLFPQWVAGLGLCAFPHFKKPDLYRTCSAIGWTVAAVGLACVIPELRLPLALILCSPLPLYFFFSNVHDPIMDYRAYSAMIGPFLLIVPVLPQLALWVIFAAWCVRSYYRILGWRTPMELWQMTVVDGGGPVAWQNLGSAHQMRGEFEKAKACYAECLREYPETGVVLLNLGLIEGMEGRPIEARDKLEECVRLNPRYAAGWNYLGQVYAFLKDTVNAERCRKQLESLST